MKTLAIRLKENDDLKVSIENIAKINNIKAAVVLSAVGCVKKAHIRLAQAVNEFLDENDYEIVSLMGTVSDNGLHLHISLSDNSGKTIGGHLMEGCLINTTCELVLGILNDQYLFHREFDDTTRYRELVIKDFDTK